MTTGVMTGRTIGSTGDRAAPRPSAVVWINGRGGVVARMDGDGVVLTCSIDRGLDSEAEFLRSVVGAIGDRERVLILGPSSERLALEREYVAIYQRPDRLIDVEPAGPVDQAQLVDRVRQLAG